VGPLGLRLLEAQKSQVILLPPTAAIGAMTLSISSFPRWASARDKLSIGLAIYANGGMNTDYKTNRFAAFGSTGKVGVNLEQLFITPSVAYRLSPRNTLGAAAPLTIRSTLRLLAM
jgi:hypothetical protein